VKCRRKVDLTKSSMESVLSEYKASLAELTFNSKPHINMLTILAEENVSYAPDIAKIIERQIFQVNLIDYFLKVVAKMHNSSLMLIIIFAM